MCPFLTYNYTVCKILIVTSLQVHYNHHLFIIEKMLKITP